MARFQSHIVSLFALLITAFFGFSCDARDDSTLNGLVSDYTVEVTSGTFADLPFGITSFGAGVDDGWLYVYGGNRGRAHHYVKEGQNGKILRIQLDNKNAQWEEIGEGPSMQGVAMIAHGGQLYRMGGMKATNSGDEDQNLVSVDEFASFDLKTRKWTNLPNLPEPRSSHDAVVVGDIIYMIGGWTIEGDKNTWLDTAWSIDLSQKLVWEKLPSPPFKRRALSVGLHGERIYAVGGMQDKAGPTRKVAYYDPAKNTWGEGPDLPPNEEEGDITGFGSSAFAVGNRIYVSTSTGSIVGLNKDASKWAELVELDEPRLFPRMVAIGSNKLVLVGGANMETGKNLEVEVLEISQPDAGGTTPVTREGEAPEPETEDNVFAEMPVGLTSFGAAVADDYLYACGGNKGGSRSFSKENQNRTFYRLRLDGKSKWEDLGVIPGRQGMAMVAHGGKLYRLGGFEAANAKGEKAALTSTDDFAVYEPATKTWTDLAPMPESRSSFDAVVMDGFVYVVGGWAMSADSGGIGAEKKESSRVWAKNAYRFNLTAENASWEKIASPPFSRRAISLAHRDGKLYVIGGMLEEKNVPTTEVGIYDPKTNEWSEGPNVPGEMMDGFGSSAYTVGGDLYFSSLNGQVSRLSKDARSWDKVHQLKNGRFFHRMVGWKDTHLVVLGGTKPRAGKVTEIEVIDVTKVKAIESDSKKTSLIEHGNWPAFLGTGADSIVADSIPIEWSIEKNLAWQITTPGYGQSSPVIWHDRVFLTSVEGEMKDQFHVFCMSLNDGKQIWKKSLNSAQKVKSSTYVSRAAPTPVVDTDRVITMFENGDLIAWTHDGEQIWKRSLVEDYGEIENGHCIAASPIQTEDAVFVLVDHNGPGYLLKVNKQDGKTVWKTDRTSRMAWNSPTLMTVGEKSCVLVSAKGSVDGYDLETGEEMWTSYSDIAGNTAATPIPFGDGRFLVGASSGRDASQAITNIAMQVENHDGKLSVKKLWDAGRASCTFGSPMVYENFAYWVGKGGILHCLDANSGELMYKERIGSSAWATPLGLGDRIYFFGKDGNTVVISTGPEFTKIATNSFAVQPETTTTAATENSDEPKTDPRITYGVAAVSGSLLIRTGDVLYCVRND